MNLLDPLYRLVGKRRPGPDPVARDGQSGCPDEADLLAYCQHNLPAGRRRRLEKHFAGCDDCRQALVLFARVSGETADGSDACPPLTPEEVERQAAKILSYIRDDERGMVRDTRRRPQLIPVQDGFYLSYPQLAAAVMLFCAVALGVIFYFMKDKSPELVARQALVLALKDGRRVSARVSGDLPHSQYTATRGADEGDDLQFDRALNKLKSAEAENAPAPLRLELARVYLSRAGADDMKRAAVILRQVIDAGTHTPEAYNDLGVAKFGLDKYEEAIEEFNRALEQSPGYYPALFNRALAFSRLKKYDEARRDYQQFIQLSADDGWKVEAQRLLNKLPNTGG